MYGQENDDYKVIKINRKLMLNFHAIPMVGSANG